jgi:hypothetical protein
MICGFTYILIAGYTPTFPDVTDRRYIREESLNPTPEDSVLQKCVEIRKVKQMSIFTQ